MEKIDGGVEETLKAVFKDAPEINANVSKTIKLIVDDIADNPTFKRFIEPAISILIQGSEQNMIPEDVTNEFLSWVVYQEGIMKFYLCTPKECEKVVFNAVSKAKKYTNAEEEINDQLSFYGLIKILALKRLENKILLKTADPISVNMFYKHKRVETPIKILISVEEAIVSAYNEINLNNY